jgi:hypothetical protein
VNADLAPALVAAGGGSVLLAGIWAHERRADEAMRASRLRLSVRFPANLDPLRAFAAVDSFSGLPAGTELVSEVSADEGGVTHFLWVPASVRSSVEAMLRGVVPSVRIGEAPPAENARASVSLRVFVPTPSVLHTEGAAAVSHTLLARLTTLGAGERVSVRWALRAGAPRRTVQRQPESQTAREIDRAWRRKTTTPGVRAAGLVLVHAASLPAARALASHVESVIRSRRGVRGELRITSERGNRSPASLPRTTGSSGWLSTAELLPLLGWPIGVDVPVGVEVGASRQLLVPRHVSREGRRLFIGRDAGGERPVAMSAEAARQHLAVVAPTGAGKSVLLMRAILDDLSGGFGGVLLDPKADLASDLLERIPAEHADRVVVLDPAGPGPLPGLDLLGGGDPDLRTDVVLSALKGIYRDAWGVRIDSYLRLGLRTLAELPNAALSDWLSLYTDPALRGRALARVSDPILIGQWRSFEGLSIAEQYQHVAPALSRITSLLSRPALRAILDQPSPRLDISRLLEQRRWLIVSLAPGRLGEPASHLLGAVLGYLVWTAIEARVALTPEQRHPIYFYCDELQSLSTLPVGLELFFERSRGLGCGVTVATQTLARLPDGVRQSLLGNVGSLITFRAGADEAARLARELPGLDAADIMGLSRFEVAARLTTGTGNAATVVTGRTEGPPPITGQGARIRQLSTQRYGGEPRRVETVDHDNTHVGEEEHAGSGRHGRKERTS